MSFNSLTASKAGSVSKRGKANISKKLIRELIESDIYELTRAIDVKTLSNTQKLQYIKCLLPYYLSSKDLNNSETKEFRAEIID